MCAIAHTSRKLTRSAGIGLDWIMRPLLDRFRSWSVPVKSLLDRFDRKWCETRHYYLIPIKRTQISSSSVTGNITYPKLLQLAGVGVGAEWDRWVSTAPRGRSVAVLD